MRDDDDDDDDDDEGGDDPKLVSVYLPTAEIAYVDRT
jgi:hypothetical protein